MRFFRLMMLAALVVLVVLGLNISNQGINNLTREERPAVFNLDYNEGDVRVEALGTSYSYSLDRPDHVFSGIKYQSRIVVNGFIEHLKKIWTIFDAVFLYE